VPLSGVFPMLSRARKIPMPDTPAQGEWVARFAATITPTAPVIGK